MKIIAARVYPLNIPFNEIFSHHLASRSASDTLVVELVTDSGVCGYGETLPRPYVTGENREETLAVLREKLPLLVGIELAEGDDVFAASQRLLQSFAISGNAARCAIELALIDAMLRVSKRSLSDVLPPRMDTVEYSGVISAGSNDRLRAIALRLQAFGFRQVKMKVGQNVGPEQVALVRQILGPQVSLRLDANGAFSCDEALAFVDAVACHDIACIEQPLPRGDLQEQARFRRASPIPVVADESLLGSEDAQALIEYQACDGFNLRLSKLGGLGPTLEIARLAAKAGIFVQIGCMVGETAILSAVGRHLAASLPELRFVEGSFGKHLLVEDISQEDISFGSKGLAKIMDGPGIGVSISREKLHKFTER